MNKFRKLAAFCAVIVLMLSFGTVAYASGGEDIPKPLVPFTPDGTGTVIDNATDGDGKEFYTITTPGKRVFYLIIDRQRESENVYFLDAVTEKDLLALAEKTGDADGSKNATPVPEPEKIPGTTPGPETSPSTAQPPASEQNSNMGTILLVLVIVVVGGGAGYYFKIYRPRKQRAESEEESDYSAEETPDDAEDGDDLPPWEDGSSGDDEK